MVLIIGGAAQGKRTYAREVLGAELLTDCAECAAESVFTAECVTDYHELIKRLLNAGEDPVSFTERFCTENPSAVVTLNEVGSGIIPLDRSERMFRKAVGECGCILAARSQKVIRMFCGNSLIIRSARRSSPDGA